jgi:hypothetical protein
MSHSSDVKARVEQLLNDVDNYEGTLWIVLAFAHEATFDPTTRAAVQGSSYWFGRKMRTSAANRHLPSNIVTPDIVVQLSPGYGIVCEARTNLPVRSGGQAIDRRWEEIPPHLEKYDDDLAGWATKVGKIHTNDLVLLVDLSRAVQMRKYLQEPGTRPALTRRFALVGAKRVSERETSVMLRKEDGALSDAALDRRLEETKQVPVKYLATKLSKCKFCDARPPVIHTARVLWENVLVPSADHPLEWVGESCTVEADLNVVTKNAQAWFGCPEDSTNAGYPRSEWVAEAMEILVKVGWATKTGEGRYAVTYRLRGRETHVHLARKVARLEQKGRVPMPRRTGRSKNPRQTEIFGGN